MRTIVKRRAPRDLIEWRQARLTGDRRPGAECSYDELRRDMETIQAVEDLLYAEQGGICAYTGCKLHLTPAGPTAERKAGFHVEHLKPQKRCRLLDGAKYGEDTDYANMVACWPPPNCGYELPYGAHKKDCWPKFGEDHLFLSPLTPSCGRRFKFDRNGNISPTNPNDAAAQATIRELGLDHRELTALRRNVLRGELEGIALNEARRSLQALRAEARRLDQGQHVELSPYCFVIEQALEREIRKLEGIRAQAKRR